jgi:replicative DNA helicase
MNTKYKKNSNEIAGAGMIPPQATDLEEAVLGSCIIEKGALDRILDSLTADMFYKESDQKIFSAMVSLFKDSEPIDMLTVVQRLRKMNELEMVGGAYAISLLSSRIAGGANIEYHAKIIAEKYMAREAIRLLSESLNNLYDPMNDVFDVITKTEVSLSDITDVRNSVSSRRMSEVIDSVVIDLAERVEKRKIGEELHVMSGFKSIDKATGGLHPGDLTIIAARPGMGKTAFALSLLKNISVNTHKPCAFFSLEVSSEQIANRLISMESGVNLSKLRDARLDDSDFEIISNKTTDVKAAEIYIDDSPYLNILELRTKARRLKTLKGIEAIFVDYLQLMKGDKDHNGTREQEISSISRNLKGLAKELKIPVIALSQLSRSVETRGGDKRPQLSDLRESGAIEQDADNVAFLYRPDYYGIKEDDNGESTEGRVEYLIRKQRHGETGDIILNFIPELGRFFENNESYDRKEPEVDYNPDVQFQPNSRFDPPF